MKTFLVFGEILFDNFGSTKKLGGAPLNFACHFASLGGNAVMASAVGDDDDGKNAVASAKKYNVKTEYIEASPYCTGRCDVTLDKDGIPSYNLVENVAYDHITPKNYGSYDGVYFGTLAQRSEESASSLYLLLEEARAENKTVFFDINIRGNFYSKEMIISSLKYTTVLKISREEIYVLNEIGLCKSKVPEEICRELSEIFPNIKVIAVTLDKDGAFVYDGKNFVYSEKPKSKVVSTVGAGDSFSAAFVYNLINGKPIENCLEKAIILSDYVVTQLGAVCDYPKELKERLDI